MAQSEQEELTRMVRAAMVGSRGFSPCGFVDEFGALVILNRDCSQLHETVPGTNFEIIRDTYTHEVVGLRINGWREYQKR